MRLEIYKTLFREYGPFISTSYLWKLLAYPSQQAFRQSKVRGSVPVEVFKIGERKGAFAKTEDVAEWISKQGKS
jgi:hypothetical protein